MATDSKIKIQKENRMTNQIFEGKPDNDAVEQNLLLAEIIDEARLRFLQTNDFSEYFRIMNVMRCESPQGFNHLLESWDANKWLTAITGELGEAANILKKINRIDDGLDVSRMQQTTDRTALMYELKKEIADVLIYLDLFCAFNGWTQKEMIIEKFNITSNKIYCPIKL